MPKKNSSSENKSVNEDEIVISLDKLAIPAAIILAGIVIALAIILTNKGKDSTPDTNLNGDTDTTDTTDEEYSEASTVIGNSPYLGDIKNAKVALVEYTDFQCPYCEKYATETKPSILKDYVDTGEIIYVIRNFPLSFHGQIAIDSANAGLCVNEIGGAEKYFEFYSKAFSKQSTDELATVAQGLGIDMNKYNTCMSENRYKDQIDTDMADGTKAGVQGTPGFIIGIIDDEGNVVGKNISGAYPYESFKSVIDEMLAK